MGSQHNENTRVQIPALIHLTRLGYKYFSLKDEIFIFDSETNIIKNIFKTQFLKLNPEVDENTFERVFTNVQLELEQDDLGRSFFNRLLGRGNSNYQLIDWKKFDNNTFHVAAEVANIKDDEEFRPDITVFINGLPLSYIEVKQPNVIRDGSTGIQAEFERQDQRFRNSKFRKFHNITQLLVFSDNMPYDETLGFQMQGSYYASTSKSNTKFNSFKEERYGELVDGLAELSEAVVDEILNDQNKVTLKNSPEFKTNLDENTPLNRFLTSLYTKERLKMMLEYGIVYVNEIDKTGQAQIQKHIMRYPQFFATKAIERKISEGTKKGIIWHTQGSGKTALAYFNVRYLTDYFQKQGKIPHFYFIVDRLDLARQAFDEFTKRGLQAKLISERKDLEKDFEGDIAVLNIQKFKNETDFTNRSGYDLNIQNIYFIDEAHRSYNPHGSYLANLYNADENSIKIALTGTPLIVYNQHGQDEDDLSEKSDRKTTRNIFGDYIHKYYYNQSIEDGYTLRLMREEIETDYKEKLQQILEDIKVQAGAFKKKTLYAHPNFAKPMLDYIVSDLEKSRIRFGDDSIGAMVVADSSEQARELFNQFNERQTTLTDWSATDELMVAGEMTYKTGKSLQAALILHDENDKEIRKDQVKAFKSGQIDILFVYSMLLTGFDAPRLKKLYLGRKIKAHNLLQTLTRVNRPYKDFRIGYVVDFADISKEFDETNQAYFEELNREYDSNDTGEELENVFGSLFVSADEISEQVRESERQLLDYSTDNLEIFSQEISQIQNRKSLVELKNALISIKENYNVAQLLGHTELLEMIDFTLISRLLNMVTSRLSTMSLLEHTDDSSAAELLNLAMHHTEFFFKKVGESELELAANDIIERSRKVATEIQQNWDQKDPEWLELFEEFQRILHQQNMIAHPTVETYQQSSSKFDKIHAQIRELNRRDNQLANRFRGDRKYARAFKRLTNSGKISENTTLYEIMKNAKSEIDSRVGNNENMLQNTSFFNRETVQVSLESMRTTGQKITPQIIKDFAKLISEEYIGEYQL